MTIQMSAEQFNELINGIRDVARPREADLHPSSGTRHFSHCPARFDGSRNASSVEEFITTASLYKRLEKISDEDALETLPILLREEALTWWNGVRNSVNTWPAAVQLIRDAFAPRAPNHRLFKEIFNEPQGDEVSTDAYITRQRERLSRMSRQLDEQWQMDILYGLLRRRLRDRIARTEVDTFADLLHKARAVEESEREGKNSHAKPNGKGPKADENRSRGPRLRCDVCRAFGHDTTACRRRPRGPAPAPGPATRTPAEPVRCYGCNAPGVFRRNCPTCNTTDASQPARNMAFCALRSGTIQPRSRPAIHIKIAGEEGTGYLDTAACNSVASATLYRHLIKTGHKARTENVIATLADGTSKHLQVPAVTTKVGVQGRHVETTFIVLSDSCDTRTLLGADFIEDARIIPDLARRRFYFGGDITRTYPFVDVDGAEAPARKGVPTTIKEVRITQSEPMEAGDIEEGYGPPPPAPPKRDTSKGLVTPHGIWTTYQAPYATEHMWEDAETAMTTGEMDEYEMGLFPDGPRRLFITSLRLQANEGTGFTEPTRAKFDDLVDDFADAFEAHGPPTPYAEHRIDTGDHAPIAVPPYQLNATKKQLLKEEVKKDAAWQWDSTHQEAFEELKQRLADAPILRQANPEEPFVLRTDASAYALGAALLQGEGPEERPIEYASRLLTNHEQNYTTTEREALAIVWAVRRFRGYLEESSTVVITDHQPLRWLMTLKTPTGRLARWALQLQPYHLTIEYTPGKANVVADMLSRPHLPEVAIDSVEVDLPTRKANELRSEQRKDEEIRKIMDDLVHAQAEISQQWTSRGYLLNQGVLYRYSQDGESEEAQLVVPKHERPRVLAEYHDSPTAGHYGVERTYYRVKRRYYWTGMRRYITDYLKGCIDCQRYKAPNLKPAGLLQTPAMGHRMEVLAVDLFGPLPPTKEHHRWVLIVEDYATRWVELFTLAEASAEACATTLVTEVFLRYGIPRRIVSDNGTQFISAVMQKITFCLGITQSFTPVYHPEANPVERKNRDLKTQLAIQIGNQPHENWDEKIPSIRFAMNSAWCSGTGYSPAYLMFGRDLRTVDDVTHDLRAITLRENFVPEATPLLLTLDETLKRAREIHESEQDRRKRDQDRHRKTSTAYAPGDLVLVKTHRLSKASQGFTSKFAPKQDGPYVVLRRHGPTSYEIAAHQQPDVVLGLYHASDLVPYQPPTQEATQPVPPVQPLRRRGRPRKIQQDQ
ncbi:hypothetical protein Zmor_020232 [Zophobas morio]|uniref:RNA-directed DNA polymerase n=1 Tax=Zophobas morio TaxID=2755281 RepID=A0AA38MA40_9CUCU|nr:hypothetical protein Zmor_020232 [Zophobas morio]